MSVQLSLARPTRRRLVRLDRATRDADLRIRCRVVLKVATGLSCRAAARALGCAFSTAARIVARFRRHGEAGLLDGRSDNGGRKVDADVRAGIAAILEQRPPAYDFPRPTWTLELIVRVVERALHVTLSVGHLWKVLHRLRVRWGRPRPVVACPWKARRRQRRIAFLRRLAEQRAPGEALFYLDEVDVHLNPKIGPDWMLPGTQRLVVTPGNNEKRYLAGAYDPLHQRLIYVEGDRKASWLFLNLLRALLDAARGLRVIHLILDNYIIHKSRLTQAWLREQGVRLRLHFLPPYCPSENRIERLWLDLHANVTRNHLCRTMAELLKAVHHYLATRFDLIEVLAHAA
jgi:transposase